MLHRFSVKDLVLITAFAAIGISIKPIVSPISKLISSPLGIPGGTISGGLYMLWLVLTVVIVNKSYSGTLFGIVQAIGVLIFGLAGNQGALSLVSYTVPGIVVDILFYLLKRRTGAFTHILLCSMANLCGALISAIVIFSHPIPILIGISALSIGSGIMGGYLSLGIFNSLKLARIIK